MGFTGQEAMPLEERLHLITSGQWRRVGAQEPPFFWSPEGFDDLRRLERQLRAECNLSSLFPDPRCFARKLNVVTVCTGHVPPGCYGEIYSRRRIAYRVKGGDAWTGVRVYHGLAHFVLADWKRLPHTEEDVWLLTVELACPAWYLLKYGPEALIQNNPWVLESVVWMKRDMVERGRSEPLLVQSGT